MSDEYRLIRKFHGSWPQWFASLDDGRFVYIRIRHGDVLIGTGESEDAAMAYAQTVKNGMEEYAGISDAVDALVELKESGYYFVADTE